jgi:hypothetical protein
VIADQFHQTEVNVMLIEVPEDEIKLFLSKVAPWNNRQKRMKKEGICEVDEVCVCSLSRAPKGFVPSPQEVNGQKCTNNNNHEGSTITIEGYIPKEPVRIGGRFRESRNVNDLMEAFSEVWRSDFRNHWENVNADEFQEELREHKKPSCECSGLRLIARQGRSTFHGDLLASQRS